MELASVRDQLNAADASVKDTQTSVDEAKAANAASEQECANLRDQLQTARTEAETAQRSIETLTAQASEHGQLAVLLANRERQLNEATASLANEQSAVQRRAVEGQAREADLGARIASLQTQHADGAERFDQLTKQVASAEAVRDQRQQQLTAAQQQAAAAEKQRDETTQTLQQTRQEVQSLTAQLQEATEQNAAQQQEVSEDKTKRQRIAEAAQQSHVRLSQQLNEKNRKLSRARQQQSDLQRQLDQLQQGIESGAVASRRQIALVNQSLTSSNVELQHYQRVDAELQAEKAKLRSELDALRRQSDQSQRSSAERATALQIENDTLRGQVGSLKANLSTTQQMFDQARADQQRQAQESLSRIDATKELAALQQEHAATMARITGELQQQERALIESENAHGDVADQLQELARPTQSLRFEAGGPAGRPAKSKASSAARASVGKSKAKNKKKAEPKAKRTPAVEAKGKTKLTATKKSQKKARAANNGRGGKASSTTTRRGASHVERDDLRLILGIGPVAERRLQKHGVKTFAEIAAWTKDDVRQYEERLDFKGRIGREKWVQQAKKLAQRASTRRAKSSSAKR